jgi:hypothetical protein
MKIKHIKSPPAGTSAIHIGADGATAAEVRTAILAVIATNAGDAVKIAAFDAIAKALAVTGLSITNCTFDIGKTP